MPCDPALPWEGLGCSCDSTTCTVTSLVLGEFNLVGSLPDSLGDLVNMMDLQLWMNSLEGTIPSTVTQMHPLVVFDLSYNSLTGSLPDALGSSLPALLALYLNNNFLSGQLTDDLGGLSTVTDFYLDTNAFSGTFPAAWSGLSSVVTMFVMFNQITGTLPSEWGNLQNLEYIQLSVNHVTGTFPSGWFNLPSLETMYLGTNALTGTLPKELAAMPRLHTFSLRTNHLTGTIPEEFGSSQVTYLRLFDNKMVGTIPPSFSNLVNISLLDLGANFFTGSIPNFSALTQLWYFYLGGNHLTGSFPEYVCGFPDMLWVALHDSFLTGTIPDCLWSMPMLQVMSFGDMMLSGTIADAIDLPGIFSIETQGNFLTGSLPEGLYHLDSMVSFIVSNNSFTGTISNSIGNLTTVDHWEVGGNLLTGTLPSSISQMTRLYFFEAVNNNLHGNMDNCFNHTIQVDLNTVTVGGNQLTGSLPMELFRAPAIHVFSAFSNCLHTVIPEEVCDSKQLVTLALDGAHTASSCRNRLFPHSEHLKAYMLSDQEQTGRIPSCLYSMPNLQTLHLSGMGWEGSLPEDVTISSSLKDLSLSHNELDGTIPSNFQNHSWRNLDLSFNFLVGDLHRVSIENSLSLQVNKLSGDLPSSMKAIPSISILDGNIFGCNYEGKQLPGRDDTIDTYDCGSNTFNASYYAWLATFVLAIVITMIIVLLIGLFGLSQSEEMLSVRAFRGKGHGLTLWLYVQSYRAHYLWNLADKPSINGFARSAAESLTSMSEGLDEVGMVCGRVIAYMLIVLVPVYVTASIYFGTYSNQYAWTVSIAYLAGGEATAMELVVLLVLMGMLLLSLHQSTLPAKTDSKDGIEMTSPAAMETGLVPIPADTLSPESTPAAPAAQGDHSKTLLDAVCVIVFVLNLVLVGGVNILFAYVSINGTSRQVFAMQVALAVFGYVWNSDRIQWLSTEMIALYSGSKSLLSLKHGKYFDSAYLLKLHGQEIEEQKQMLGVQLGIAMINAVLIPCIVTAALSSSCFYYALRAAPEVSAVFQYDDCISGMGQPDGSFLCLAYATYYQHTSYSPPFSYSYQCSAVLLTYYAPSLMYTCMTDGFLSPFLQLTSSKLYGWMKSWLTSLQAMPSVPFYASWLENAVFWMRWRVVPDLLQPIEVEAGSVFPEYRGQTFVSGQGIMVNLVTYIALLLTFGVVFPPLGFALAITIMIYMYYHRWMLGKYLQQLDALKKAATVVTDEMPAPTACNDSTIYQALAMECGGFPRLLQATKWMLVVAACWFYAMFMADTVGYEYGTKLSYWIIVLMGLMPLGLFALDKFVSFAIAKHYNKSYQF